MLYRGSMALICGLVLFSGVASAAGRHAEEGDKCEYLFDAQERAEAGVAVLEEAIETGELVTENKDGEEVVQTLTQRQIRQVKKTLKLLEKRLRKIEKEIEKEEC